MCLEQGCQAQKAIICGENEALRISKETESQVLMKITDHKINTTEGWEKSKLQVMEELLFSKFRETRKSIFYF